jgi:O-antigen ligase
VVLAVVLLIALPVPGMMARRNLDLTLGPGMIRASIDSIKKEERWAIWRASIDKISERPVLGHGFGNKEIFIPGFRVENIYPHNLFLSYGVMTGLAGSLVVLMIFARLFMLLNSAVLSAHAGGLSSYGVPLAGVLLLAVFVILNMTEDVMIRHTGQFFWALMGMTLGALRGEGDRAGGGTDRSNAGPDGG